jgi:membrane protease YdiL (CAAX protease family)
MHVVQLNRDCIARLDWGGFGTTALSQYRDGPPPAHHVVEFRHLAVLVSAVFFAAAHLEPVALLPILLLGVVLAYTYEYTGSLVPGMMAHGVNNLVALFIFYQNPPPGP